MVRVIETVTKYAYGAPCKTAAEMKEVCCTNTPALQCCEKVEEWGGYSDDEVLRKAGIVVDDQGRDSKGRYVEVRSAPRSKPCGEQVVRHDTTPSNCCEKVAPMVVDGDRSVDVLASNSLGVVYVVGGQLPLRVQVDGWGFYVADDGSSGAGYKNAEVWGRAIPIKTLNVCGACKLYITDNCGNRVVAFIRATTGRWTDDKIVNKWNSPEAICSMHRTPSEITKSDWQFGVTLYGDYGDTLVSQNYKFYSKCLFNSYSELIECVSTMNRNDEAGHAACVYASSPAILNDGRSYYWRINSVNNYPGFMSIDIDWPCTNLFGTRRCSVGMGLKWYYYRPSRIRKKEWRC